MPALHVAIQRLDVDTVQQLIADGARIGAVDTTGRTALHVAADSGPGAPEVDAKLERIVEMLIAAGADVNAHDADGATPLRYAIDRGHERVAALLRDRGGIAIPVEPSPMLRGGYRMYDEIGPLLLAAETNYPDICRRYDLGVSVQGRHLWALLITDNPDIEEDEPEFRYVSTMHGNEWTGTEMCLYFIDYVTSNYGTDSRVTDIVDSVELWIVPMMNPDGHEASPATRYNAQGIDLNRNFPDVYASPADSTAGRAPETAAIMNWCLGRSFTLAANFHTGSLVTVYPFDGNAEFASVDTPTPDDDVFEWGAREYSQHNTPMWNSISFSDGVTNGADWYALFGSLQDWSYRFRGTNEVTIELSNSYIPSATQMPTYWNNNRESMLAFLETCLIGIRGLTIDETSGDPVAAAVTINGRDHAVYADPDVGDYHRLLRPGTYDLRFEADGYDPVVATDIPVAAGPATMLDVDMPVSAEVVAPNGGDTLHVGQPATITWTGSPTASFQVQVTEAASDIDTEFDGFENGSLTSDYNSGGNASWTIASGTAYEGTFAARSGAIGNNATTWMARTIVTTGETEIRFWYRVSSESGFDYFRFFVGGQMRIQTSGDSGWLEYVETLGPGTHKLQWEYTKDGGATGGSDRAWVDAFTFSDDNVVWTDIVPMTAPGATAVSWTPATAGNDFAVRVRGLYDDIDGVWDASDAAFEVAAAALGDFDGDGDVDLSDFSQFSLCFGGANNPPAAMCPPGVDADFDDDGDVDLGDFSIFALNFTGAL